MVQKKWNKDAPIVLEDHLVHIRDLVDDAFQQKYEAGWYHPANHALTFNAFRTSSKGGMLSVYPQAKLSLLGRQKRERRNVPEMAPAAEAEQDVGGKEPEEEQGAVPYEEKEEPSESRSAHHHHDRSSEPGDSGDRDDPKSQFPDFVVIEKFPSKRNFAVFVVEVKPPPPDFHTIHKESVKKVKVENIMKRAESQNVQQAQFAFAEFPMQTVVHIFCMVATYFRVLTFHRSELPEIGEYWPRTPKFSASEMSSMFKISEDGEYTDYSKTFKSWWTRAMDRQEKQEARELEMERTRKLVRDVVKEAAAVAAAKNAAENAGADPIVAGNDRENAASL